MSRKTLFVKDFYYSASDDCFVKEEEVIPLEFRKVLTTYKYVRPETFPDGIVFKRNDPPLAFHESPESLLNLAINFIDKIPLPMVYTWTTEQVCRWLRSYGYPQYQETFRVNLIIGRTLLLLDASALSAMNIKDFDHIRHIAYGIRCLFNFEMTKFGRSISLPPEYHLELYKLLRVKNGTKYDNTKALDLWRRMQLIRPFTAYKEHWEILESWLNLERDVIERFGGFHRHNLYKCNIVKVSEEVKEPKPCHCMPPCECYWTEREIRIPKKLTLLTDKVSERPLPEENILSVLVRAFPERYMEEYMRDCKRGLESV